MSDLPVEDSTAATTIAPEPRSPAPARSRGGTARNTVVFSAATGLSRVAGLVREVVAARYFGTSGAMSAFTLAFQVPNLVRSLFADAALSAAFVPIFTELLERGEKRDAARLAATLLCVIVAALTAVCALFVLAAGVIMPLFTSDFPAPLQDLAVGLSRVLFPIVLLLGINGLVVGMLNAQGHFSVPAIAPLAWNVVIIVGLVVLEPLFTGNDRLYAYAIAVLAGTVVQLVMCLPVLARIDVRFDVRPQLRDPRLKRIFVLMVPITVGLGIINFDVLVSSIVGGLISEQVPSAIEKAFRVYMLPQGMFSVAVATVLFPALSRLAARGDLDGLRATMAGGIRQIWLLLVPAGAFCAILADPIIRLLYQRGEFTAQSTHLTGLALLCFSIALPFSGINLLLTRTCFSLQQPWIPTKQSVINLAVNAVVAAALYKPLGIFGVVLGTVLASVAMTIGLTLRLRPLLGGGLEGRRNLDAGWRILLASGVMAEAAFLVHHALDALLGRGLLAQVIAVGAAMVVAIAAYVPLLLMLDVEDAKDIRAVLPRRFGRP